jgi:hypothetical protein
MPRTPLGPRIFCVHLSIAADDGCAIWRLGSFSASLGRLSQDAPQPARHAGTDHTLHGRINIYVSIRPAENKIRSRFIISARISSALASSLMRNGLFGSPANFIADNPACRLTAALHRAAEYHVGGNTRNRLKHLFFCRRVHIINAEQ